MAKILKRRNDGNVIELDDIISHMEIDTPEDEKTEQESRKRRKKESLYCYINEDEEVIITAVTKKQKAKLAILETSAARDVLKQKISRQIDIVKLYEEKHAISKEARLQILYDTEDLSKARHKWDDPASAKHGTYDFSQYRPRQKMCRAFYPKLDSDIHFFMSRLEYKTDYQQRLYIAISGIVNIDGLDFSCMIKAYGFKPYLIIRRMSGWNEIEMDDLLTELDNALKKYPFSRTIKECFPHPTNRWVTNFQFMKAAKYDGYSKDPIKDFVKIEVVHPKMVSALRELLQMPSDGEVIDYYEVMKGDGQEPKKKKLPSWEYDQFGITLDNNGRSNVKVYEADCDYVLRALVDNLMTPSTNFLIPKGKWIQLARRFDETDAIIGIKYDPRLDDISDICFETEFSDIIPEPKEIERDKIPDLVKVTVDTEWKCDGRFPLRRISPCVCVVVRVRYKKDEEPKDFGFTVGYTEDIPECAAVFWYSDESSMLKGLIDFIIEMDPDILVHFNGNGFDFPYLMDRCSYLGIHGFDFIGRSTSKRVGSIRRVKKQKDTWTLDIPGRLNNDIMVRIRQEEKFDDFNLNFVSLAILGVPKASFDVELIKEYVKTVAGRRKILSYCWKDVDLTDKISEKKMTIPIGIETSRLSGEQFQVIQDRQQSAKVQARIRHESFRYVLEGRRDPKDEKREQKVESMPVRLVKLCKQRKVKTEKYKGADVITPIAGFYDEPVVVLDCASMYPSNIKFRNACHTTEIKRSKMRKHGLTEDDVNFVNKRIYKPGVVDEEWDPDGPAFVKNHIRYGILPRLETELGNNRSKIRKVNMVEVKKNYDEILEQLTEKILEFEKKRPKTIEKKEQRDYVLKWLKIMKKEAKKEINFIKEISSGSTKVADLEFELGRLDSKQLAIKIWMNSIYGITGDETNIYSNIAIATSITADGRWLLNIVKIFVENTFNKKNGYPFDAIVIYGDTDSVMVWLSGFGTCVPSAFSMGSIISQAVNAFVAKYKVYTFEFEKIYTGFNLVTSKNYAGLKWNPPGLEANKLKTETKGMRHTKRGTSLFTKKIGNTCSALISEKLDIEEAKKVARTAAYSLNHNKVNLGMLIIKGAINKKLEDYEQVTKKNGQSIRRETKRAVVSLAKRLVAKNPGLDFGPGSYLKFIIVKNNQVKLVSDRSETPEDVLIKKLEPDKHYYLDELRKVLVKVFAGPLGYGRKPGTHPKKILESYEKDGKTKYKLSTEQVREIGKEIFGYYDLKNLPSVKLPNYEKLSLLTLTGDICIGCELELKPEERNTNFCETCKPFKALIEKSAANQLQQSYDKFKGCLTTCIECLTNNIQNDISSCVNYGCENYTKRTEAGDEFEYYYSKQINLSHFSDTVEDAVKTALKGNKNFECGKENLVYTSSSDKIMMDVKFIGKKEDLADALKKFKTAVNSELKKMNFEFVMVSVSLNESSGCLVAYFTKK